MKAYLWNILLWIDQGGNVWAGPLLNRLHKTDLYGDPDEVISSVLGKLQQAGQDTRLRRFVDWCALKLVGQHNHCQESIEADEGKKTTEVLG